MGSEYLQMHLKNKYRKAVDALFEALENMQTVSATFDSLKGNTPHEWLMVKQVRQTLIDLKELPPQPKKQKSN